jgi:DNA-binding response OmpR family regulator
MSPSVAAELMRAAASGSNAQVAAMRGLRDYAQRLEDRIAELESLLGINMPAILGLTKTQTVILGMLVAAPSGVVGTGAIITALYGARPEADQPKGPEKVIHVQVNSLRKKLGTRDIAIETRASVGYFMTSANKARVRALLDSETES